MFIFGWFLIGPKYAHKIDWYMLKSQMAAATFKSEHSRKLPSWYTWEVFVKWKEVQAKMKIKDIQKEISCETNLYENTKQM